MKILSLFAVFLFPALSFAGFYPTLFLDGEKTSGGWIAASIYDSTSQEWEHYYHVDPQLLVGDPLISGRWYWVQLWDYGTGPDAVGKMLFAGWIGSHIGLDDVSEPEIPQWFADLLAE